jgi:predicted RNA binding protein YcfA (HicA-like mRNA interferase family)
MNTIRKQMLIASIPLTLLIIFLAAVYFSGRLAASSIVSAIETKNYSIIANKLDHARLKASAADDLTELVPQNLKLGSLGNVSNDIRTLINNGISNIAEKPSHTQMVANLLSGKGFISSDVTKLIPSTFLANRTPNYKYEQGNESSIYLLKVDFPESGEQVVATLERRGWFTWRMVRLVPNSPSVMWPFKAPK